MSVQPEGGREGYSTKLGGARKARHSRERAPYFLNSLSSRICLSRTSPIFPPESVSQNLSLSLPLSPSPPKQALSHFPRLRRAEHKLFHGHIDNFFLRSFTYVDPRNHDNLSDAAHLLTGRLERVKRASKESEKERHTERKTERQRQIETDRETARQRQRDGETETEKGKCSRTDTLAYGLTPAQTGFCKGPDRLFCLKKKNR